ncbi:hypothetical protein EAS64_31070 [Trebonia kvetii]|uniref:Uncharacterized protein n=1 Tax=Trebonia kvetii TaxID=2480626 RepID=A0A6P2BXH4_9ACTN|nr:hypothetical protein [Trebonia kvetii]TVZ01883.1 hypothetical protein EAS64_31070 [Trebonia kvetii]
MEYHDTGFSRRPPQPEPSWPTVIATTVRLWLERHPVPGRRWTWGRLAVLVAVLISAVAAGVAGVAIGRTGRSSAAAPSTAAPSTAAPLQATAAAAPAGGLGYSIATRDRAAQWVAQQIAPGAIVACDPAMCAALQADGLPAARLLVLGTAAADPLGSDVVVATPAVRNQFGGRLASVYAPAVIARFGSGAAQIDIRAIAPSGAAAYRAALAADKLARIDAGRQLLRNAHIDASSAVKTALRSGDVDPRLLITLAALATQQPLRILAFTDPSPGAPAAPLRGVELAPAHSGGRTGARLQSMLSFLHAQRVPFLPLRASVDRATDVSFEYAAPSPLGAEHTVTNK